MRAFATVFAAIGFIVIVSGISFGTRAELAQMSEIEILRNQVSFIGGFLMVGLSAIILILCDIKKESR